MIKCICDLCKAESPHIRGLLEHYEIHHPEVMKRYELFHRPTQHKGLVAAPSPDEACAVFGWTIEECKIKEV